MLVEGIASQSSVVFETWYTLYIMTEKTQFPGFMFMFPQVVQRRELGEVG